MRYDLAKGALTYDVAYSNSNNLLTAQESSLEDGTTAPYTSSSGATLDASNTYAHDGTYSLRVTANGAASTTVLLSDITVTPGVSYVFSWYGRGSVQRNSGGFTTRHYDANGTLLNTDGPSGEQGTVAYTTTGMTEKWNLIVPIAGTAYIEIEMTIANALAGEMFYLDGMDLYRGSSGGFGFFLGAAGGPCTDIVRYLGTTVFVSSDSVFYRNTTDPYDPAILVTSMADWSNKGDKVWDYIEIEHKPLPANTSIAVYYTTKEVKDGGWTLAGTSDTDGSEGKTFTLTNVVGATLALKFEFTSSAPNYAVLKGFAVRSNPKPSTPEWVLTRYVNLTLGLRKGKAQGWNKEPRTVRRQLQDMLYENVTFYDEEGTWTGRLQQIQDVEPEGQPDAPDTSGKSDENSYVMALTIQATRDA